MAFSPAPFIVEPPSMLCPTPPPSSLTASTSPPSFSPSPSTAPTTSVVAVLKTRLAALKAREGHRIKAADEAEEKADDLKWRAASLKDAIKVKENRAKELRDEACAQLDEAAESEKAVYYDIATELEDLGMQISDLEAEIKRAGFDDMLLKRYRDPVIRKMVQGVDKSDEMEGVLEAFMNGEVSLQDIDIFETKLDAIAAGATRDRLHVASEADASVKTEEQDDVHTCTGSSDETMDREKQQDSISSSESVKIHVNDAPQSGIREALNWENESGDAEVPPTAAEIKRTLAAVRAHLRKFQTQLRPSLDPL